MASRPDRRGFSLIEALVVLAVGGMALSLIFSIGIRAGDSGFALGRRAMAAADADVSAADLRSVMRGFLMPPDVTVRTTDQPLIGTPTRLEGDVVAERATPCAPQGWSGRMVLEIVPVEGGGTALTCRSGGERVTLSTSVGPASLAYSIDGTSFTPVIDTTPPRTPSGDLRERRIWIRYAAPEGDVVETAASGVPATWLRRDDF